MKAIRISCVVGARPNFVKMASLIRELDGRPRFRARLIHTGQHYSPEMSGSFFDDLDLREPDVNLGVGGGTQSGQTAALLCALEAEMAANRPDAILLVGDVNSTMAAALVGAKSGIPIAHVEAGLRSFDRRMPEEINRLITDCLSTHLFATEPRAVTNLLAEGVAPEKIHLVGNVMIDTLLRFRERAAASGVLERLGAVPKGYAVATLHRPENVDDPARLRELVDVLQKLTPRIPVVFPVHPRTRQAMASSNIECGSIVLTPPLGYLDFLHLMSEARLVLTDSGGIQEETTILGVPCLTMRENTERPITLEQGTNRLVGVESTAILAAAYSALESPGEQKSTPELWDGKASIRIADTLEAAY